MTFIQQHLSLLHGLNRIRLFAAVVIAVSFCITKKTSAQVPQFRELEVVTKISKTKILLIAQDSSGYIWLGTDAGILRYDGITTIEIPLPDSISAHQSTAIYITHEKVYAGFEDGSIIAIDRFKNVIVQAWHLVNSPISSIVTSSDHIVWAGTEGAGLIRISENGFQLYSTDDGLADLFVHDLAIVHENLAVATDLGLSLCNISGGNIACRNFTQENGLTDNLILSLCSHGIDNLMLGMQNGTVCNLNISSNKIDRFENINALGLSPISKILQLGTEILIVTEMHGVFNINWTERNQVQQFHLYDELDQRRMPDDCIIDQEGDLLVVFGDNKISIADFRLQFIRQHDNEQFADAQCVITDKEGNLWFANSKGIFRHAGEFSNNQFIELYYEAPSTQDKIITMCEGYDHTIWFGTFGSGVGIIDIKTKEVKLFTEKNGLVNNNVLSMTRRDSTIWMATLGGAATIDISGKQYVFNHYDSKTTLGINFIYTVYNDTRNNIWLGTDGRGLVKLEDGNFTSITDRFPNAGKSITSIAEDNSGNIWFNSTDKGLQWTDGNSVQDIKLIDEIDQPDVYAIHGDPFGNIVALTSAGIATIYRKGESTSYIKTGFDISVNYLNVIARDIKGRLWLGTEEAMIRYSEYNIVKNIRPKTWIENVEVMLQAIDTTQHKFPFNKNHFTFKLTSIWLQAPQDVIYQYKLDGFDVDWVTTLNRTVTFPQLPPGQYTFRVRSSASNDWTGAEERYYSFEIIKPYWQQIWFILLLVSIVILIAWIIVKIRLNSIKRREMAAREKVQSQFETLRNQVNPHFLFNSFNTLISVISSDKNAAINYVEKLSDYFRIVLEQREKDVISLKEELELVQNYLYVQKQRFGDNLAIHVELDKTLLKSVVPPLTIQLLVENAIKHNTISRNRPLTIHVTSDGQSIFISNNIQEKLSKEPSTGIGLTNIRHRYRILFNKEIGVKIEDDNFIVMLPINLI